MQGIKGKIALKFASRGITMRQVAKAINRTPMCASTWENIPFYYVEKLSQILPEKEIFKMQRELYYESKRNDNQ